MPESTGRKRKKAPTISNSLMLIRWLWEKSMRPNKQNVCLRAENWWRSRKKAYDDKSQRHSLPELNEYSSVVFLCLWSVEIVIYDIFMHVNGSSFSSPIQTDSDSQNKPYHSIRPTTCRFMPMAVSCSAVGWSTFLFMLLYGFMIIIYHIKVIICSIEIKKRSGNQLKTHDKHVCSLFSHRSVLIIALLWYRLCYTTFMCVVIELTVY